MLKLAKEFSTKTRFAVPRAVFILMIFCFLAAFFSSMMTGLAVSASSAFLSFQGGERLSVLAFLFIEFLSLAFILLLHYGLFLCNLRFVRNQPVALSFLFAGIRQRRARRGAVFFIAPMIACLALFSFICANVDFFALPAIQTPEALLDFIKNNPDSVKTFLSCFVLLLALAFVFYFPFTFVWLFVYDNNKQSFWKSLLQGLKFFGHRGAHFFAFEVAAHFRKFFWIFAIDALHAFIFKKYQSAPYAYSVLSFLGFASFALSFYAAASVILSIQFYYDKFNNEDSDKESSN